MDADSLRTLVAILRDGGVTHYEDDQVTIVLGSRAVTAPKPAQSEEDRAAERESVMYGVTR